MIASAIQTLSIVGSVAMNVKVQTLDSLFDRKQTKTYNCLDFCREAWLALTGEDITERLSRLTGAFSQRRATAPVVKAFTHLKSPVNPCLVVFQRRGTVPHIGIYKDRRILHLHARGVEFQPLVVAREYFTSLRYYK